MKKRMILPVLLLALSLTLFGCAQLDEFVLGMLPEKLLKEAQGEPETQAVETAPPAEATAAPTEAPTESPIVTECYYTICDAAVHA